MWKKVQVTRNKYVEIVITPTPILLRKLIHAWYKLNISKRIIINYIILIRKDMNVNIHERLSSITLEHKIKAKEQGFSLLLLSYISHSQ